LGKAVAEAFNERVESAVGEFLSTIGRLQAEQQKQIQDFQVVNYMYCYQSILNLFIAKEYFLFTFLLLLMDGSLSKFVLLCSGWRMFNCVPPVFRFKNCHSRYSLKTFS
jgi:hypothetical protein